jgi:hypothetical protein
MCLLSAYDPSATARRLVQKSPLSADRAMQPGHQREGAGVVAAFHRKLVFLDGVGDRFGEIGEEFFEPLGFGTVPRPNRYAFPLRLDRLGIVFDGVDYDLAACLFGSVFEIVLGLGRFTATLGLLKAANTPLMVKIGHGWPICFNRVAISRQAHVAPRRPLGDFDRLGQPRQPLPVV